MAKAGRKQKETKKKKKEPFSWKKFGIRFAIVFSTIAVLSIVVPIGVSYASHDRVARTNAYDQRGNYRKGFGAWVERLGDRWQDGVEAIKGNFTQFGNHTWNNSYGKNSDTANQWAKQKGKLTHAQLYGGYRGGDVESDLSRQGLYKYADNLGIDHKAYKSDKALMNAVAQKLNQKSGATDRAGAEGKRLWGSLGREADAQKKVWQNYTTGLLKAQSDLSKTDAKRVNDYLKKHGGEKGSDKWYKALDTALTKYAHGKAKKEAEATKKKRDKEQSNVGEGEMKNSPDDVKKMLEEGNLPEPTTLWGKIGKALMNVFWSGAISDWLEKNGPGQEIFAGTDDPSTLAAQVQDDPKSLIYPTSKTDDYSTMTQVSDWLQPAMIAAGGALITLTLVITTMRMGWGQAIDPVRSRMAWYQNIIDSIIAVSLIAAFPLFVTEVLQVDGALLMGFADFMSQITPNNSSETVFQTALKLGFDRSTLNAISSGMLLGGSDFAGVIFEIIYLIAFVGLAVYIKYFYFVRAITFTVLVGIGPIFMALWSFNPTKGRTFAWLKDFIGTVFINVIHALTLTFMALFMNWNNSRITSQAANYISAVLNWQKANPGRQLLSTLTLGIAGGPSAKELQGAATASGGTINGASVFEVLVVGFIIMLLFQPLSKSLAQLFGISTNMLDNISHSTSNTLKAGALIGGGALIAGSVAPAAIAGRTIKEGAGALKDGIKANRGKKALDWRDKLKNTVKGTYASANRRKPFRSSLAKINGIVGPGAGRLIGFAAGAGAGDPTTMLALSKAGGAMGERAARLANKPLSALGLGQVYRAGRYLAKKKPGENKYIDSKVKAANAKTQDSLAQGGQAVRDANDGHTAVDANIANIEAKKKAVEDEFRAGNITSDYMNKQLGDLNDQERKLKSLKNDEDFQGRLAQADARKQTSGSYVDASNLASVTKGALGAEASKLNASEAGQADGVQQSLALAGAATSGAVMSRYDGDAVEKAAQTAKVEYAKANAGKYAQNGFNNKEEWMDSSQYRQGEATAMQMARQQAVVSSNGKVFSMPDQANNSAFGSSMVNKDVYKQDLAQRMQAAGISSEAQQKVMDAIDGVQGKALMSETKINGSNTPLQTLDYGLNNELAKQNAFTINNAGNADSSKDPVSAYDLAQVYKGDANPASVIGGGLDDSLTASSFQQYMKKNAPSERLNNLRAGLSSFYTDYQNNQAALNNATDSTANGTDTLSMGNWFGGGSSFGGGFGGFNGGHNFGGASATPNDLIASQRISNFNKEWGPVGMSPSEAIDTLTANASPSADGSSIGGSGIPAGDFQLVTGNTGSYIRAKMDDGSYQLVGNWGAGDPSLQGDESIIQNLDVSPDGTIGPRYDNNTHRMENPFSMVGDAKVARAYSNGGPDLSQMLGGFASKARSHSVDMSDYNTMQQAPELRRAYMDDGYMTLDKLGSNYTDYQYYSDGDHGVIVGKDSRDGLYKQISNIVDEDMIEGHAQGQQYSIPLVDSGNGLVPDPNADPHVYSKDPMTTQSEKEVIDTLRTHMDNIKARQEFNSYLNEILQPTERNLHNYIAKNPANQGIDFIDFSGK